MEVLSVGLSRSEVSVGRPDGSGFQAANCLSEIQQRGQQRG